jgi:hypothetical protein
MMAGTVFFDEQFLFEDGELGKKLFVILGSGSVDGNSVFLCVKTTSKGYRYKNDHGCQSNHRIPNFHIAKHACQFFSKPTWICLDSYYELAYAPFLKKHCDGIMRRLGVLPTDITKCLLDCALMTDDITGKQCELVKQSLTDLLA